MDFEAVGTLKIFFVITTLFAESNKVNDPSYYENIILINHINDQVILIHIGIQYFFEVKML